ncbi:MAG: transporter substrate-binding domain-containing protein [Comamonas sp.]
MYFPLSRRSALGAFAALGLSALATAHAASLADIQVRKSINVGIQTDYPPYGYIDASFKPQGSDVATAELIAKQLGVKLNIVTVTSPARIPALQSGKVDLIISSMGKNPEREKVVDFSISYAPFFSGIYARKGLAIAQFSDLTGKSVAVTRGSLQDDALTKLAPAGAQIKRFEDDTATIASFVTGQSDVLAHSAAVAGLTMQRNPKLDAEYKLLLTDVPCFIGVAKDNKALLDQVNNILRTAKADGSLNAISQKYLGRPLGNLPE